MSESTSLRSHLMNHPKLVSALFTVLLLLSQVGSVQANGLVFYAGP